MKSEKILNKEHTWPYHGSKLIPKDQLKPFLKRDNISGLKHLFLHLSLIVISGSLIYVSPNLILKSLGISWMPGILYVDGVFVTSIPF